MFTIRDERYRPIGLRRAHAKEMKRNVAENTRRSTVDRENPERTREDFAKATPKSLMAVKGVTRKVAEELLEHFRETMAQVR